MYLVSLVEAEPHVKWVDRWLIISRHRMLSSHGCCVRRYTIQHQYTILPGVRYDLAQLYQKITYSNVPGTWYLSWKRSPTRNGFDGGLIISRHRMLSSHGCCVRRYTTLYEENGTPLVPVPSTPSPRIRYDLAQLHQNIP